MPHCWRNLQTSMTYSCDPSWKVEKWPRSQIALRQEWGLMFVPTAAQAGAAVGSVCPTIHFNTKHNTLVRPTIHFNTKHNTLVCPTIHFNTNHKTLVCPTIQFNAKHNTLVCPTVHFNAQHNTLVLTHSLIHWFVQHFTWIPDLKEINVELFVNYSFYSIFLLAFSGILGTWCINLLYTGQQHIDCKITERYWN